ncbi:MAG: hypothetical protein Cons2KO_21200 [Congregibacter sp.]
MNRTSMSRKVSINHLGAAAVAAGALIFFGAGVATAASDTTEAGQVWHVEMKGKPPYKRTRVDAPSVDLAAMEIVKAGSAETVTVWEREVSGRPPFARKQVEVPVMDAASMEIVDDQEETTVFRGRPPFKRN